MSTIPKYHTRAEAMVDFEARRCPRWVYVDGWQIDLLAAPPVLEPVERVEPVTMAPSVTHPDEPPTRADHALASTIVAMACGVRWAGLSEEEKARVAALVDEIGRVVRPRNETNQTNEGANQ